MEFRLAQLMLLLLLLLFEALVSAIGKPTTHHGYRWGSDHRVGSLKAHDQHGSTVDQIPWAQPIDQQYGAVFWQVEITDQRQQIGIRQQMGSPVVVGHWTGGTTGYHIIGGHAAAMTKSSWECLRFGGHRILHCWAWRPIPADGSATCPARWHRRRWKHCVDCFTPFLGFVIVNFYGDRFVFESHLHSAERR